LKYREKYLSLKNKNQLIQNGGGLNFLKEFNDKKNKYILGNPYQTLVIKDINNSMYYYISDSKENCVCVLNKNGDLERKFGSSGEEDGQFNNLSSIEEVFIRYSEIDNLALCDTGNHRIQIMDGNGRFITKFGSKGKGNLEFIFPYCVKQKVLLIR
jgi:hypothetical protein